MSRCARATVLISLGALLSPRLAPGRALVAQASTSALTTRLAAPSVEFTKVGTVLELPGHRALVADAGENRLVVVDLRSGASHDLGRAGGGPGEFRIVGRLLPRHDGGAYLVDFVQRRLLPIGADTTLGGTIRFAGSIQVREIDDAGRIYGETFLPRQGGELPDSMLILRWTPGATGLDTLMRYDAAAAKMIVHPGGTYQVFHPKDAWVVTRDGDIVVLEAATYRVTRWHEGRPVQTVTEDFTPLAVTEADRQAWLKEQSRPPRTLAGGRGGSPTSASPSRPRMQYEFPATFPAFPEEGVHSAPNDGIWIERFVAATDTLARFDVLDARDGRLLGRVTLPRRMRLVGFGRASVFVVERDADDIERLRQYALPAWASR